MKFIDEVEINVISGRGGKGRVAFRREKFVPRGGPDGGCGGKGGDVYIEASDRINTLVHFRGQKTFQAEDGHAGMGGQCDGPFGKDVTLRVPLGTIIINSLTGERIADLNESGQKILLAKGGRGGLGNMYYKTSTNQAPDYAGPGEEGERIDIKLELKLLADVALIGLPNAGKSTLISVLSAARPKIADYPFTTLVPNLGVVSVGDHSFVVADIPGLIEGAGQGKGLGVKFLKHIQRSGLLIHLIDCAMFIDPFEAIEAYATIRTELEYFSDELAMKEEIVCITKTDAMTDEEEQLYVATLEENLQKKVLPISSVTGKNIEKLKFIISKTLEAKKFGEGREIASQDEVIHGA
jgi:GTP-binding protein